MEILFKQLYKLYVQELLNLNIGYTFNKKRLDKMTDLVNALHYIQNGRLTNDEIIKIIQYYGET